MDSLFAIIVAGGRGMRMGQDVPKQFIPLGEKPVLMHTLERFYQFNPNLSLILVLPADQFAYWKALCKKHLFELPHQLVEGGETRFHSVQNGLTRVTKGLVAIHDGVRPFVSMETIARCFSAAETCGAAIPVTNMIESLRMLSGNKSKALPRDSYRAVQTPQVFRAGLIKSAYNQPYNNTFTDDASVVEAAGYEVTLVEGNRENIKITTPFDLLIADSLLKRQAL
jgi:2-C-methyl-D-erythritol 4-phosphate cytidylyltransferase